MTVANPRPLSFSPRHWERLLAEINDGQVIPVIGPELLQMELADRTESLYGFLARELAARLQIQPGDAPTLTQITEAWQQAGGDPLEVYHELWEILRRRTWPTPAPLKQLATITDFNLYVTVTFDGLMKQALDEVRFAKADRTVQFTYSKHNLQDLPSGAKADSPPVVYRLFGGCATIPDYVVTEEDLLVFNHRLQSRAYQPQNLFDRLRAKYLLALGCSFPDWLTRFFLCSTKGESLLVQRAPGVFADEASRRDPALVAFLGRLHGRLYDQGGAVEFVGELSERWRQQYGAPAPAGAPGAEAAEEPAPFEADSVFISYASEDRPAARQIKEALEQVGLSVWFDQRRLEGGDDFKNKILRNIERSWFFLPILSRHTLTLERRFFRLEWVHAVEEAKFRPPEPPFIQPVLVDDSDAQSPLLPEDFRRRQIVKLENGQLPASFLEATTRRFRQFQRQQRAPR